MDIENESVPERPETATPETGHDTEVRAISGAEILEGPQDGSFLHGLQAFIAWVSDLVADHPKK